MAPLVPSPVWLHMAMADSGDLSPRLEPGRYSRALKVKSGSTPTENVSGALTHIKALLIFRLTRC